MPHYRAIVYSHYSRTRGHAYGAIAAGTLAHCCAAARRHGPGATVTTLDRRPLASLYSYCGHPEPVQSDCGPEGSAAVEMLAEPPQESES
jgi:hypothetical protein